MKKIVFAFLLLCASGQLFACYVEPSISGTSTATLINGGRYDNLYLYTIKFEWNLTKDISHWDIILKPGCADSDHIFIFSSQIVPSQAGIFCGWGNRWTSGFNKKGDKSLNPDVIVPVIKFEPTRYAGQRGSGTVYFYSNVIPEYNGPYSNVLVAKAGCGRDTYGSLVGAYPSCSVTPEPTTIVLFGLGFLVMLRKKR